MVDAAENDVDDFEFHVKTPLPNWDDDRDSFDRSLNCHGVVYVRLLSAQRCVLPCSLNLSFIK